MHKTENELYYAAVAADDAWSVAICNAFPRERAGDVRYMAKGKGDPGYAYATLPLRLLVMLLQ